MKHPSYEAFYESQTAREYPYGNRHRMLDEDLKNQAAGGMLKMGSFQNLMATSGAQRRTTNLGNDPSPVAPASRPSFFSSFRRSSKGLPPMSTGQTEETLGRPASFKYVL